MSHNNLTPEDRAYLAELGITPGQVREGTTVINLPGGDTGAVTRQPNGRVEFSRLISPRQIRQRQKTLAKKAARKARRKSGGSHD